MNLIIKNKRGDNNGFIVLTMVLLVFAVVLAVATGIFLRALSEMNENADSEAALKAWGVVNACGEYALGQMATTSGGLSGWSYVGDDSVAVGAETCYIYAIADGESGAKLIQASSTVSGFTKKILIEVATNTPSVVVNSWTEVADF